MAFRAVSMAVSAINSNCIRNIAESSSRKAGILAPFREGTSGCSEHSKATKRYRMRQRRRTLQRSGRIGGERGSVDAHQQSRNTQITCEAVPQVPLAFIFLDDPRNCLRGPCQMHSKNRCKHIKSLDPPPSFLQTVEPHVYMTLQYLNYCESFLFHPAYRKSGGS
jgi:hypothetical protein